MLGKFFETLYLKVFVNIIVGHSKSTVYIELCKEDRVINSVEESFTTTTVNSDMEEFISSYTSESPYHYISVLDFSESQGAAPVCTKSELSNFFDNSSSKHICNAGNWTYYTSKSDINRTKQNYSKVGLDFIFSPFILLSDFFKDKIDSHTAMFILVEDEYLSLAVFENSKLLFAEHLNMGNDIEMDEILIDDSDSLGMENSIDLDEVDVLDDMEILDDFGDIEDLDSIEDINEFSESQDIEEEFKEDIQDELPMNEDEGFNEDYQRFLLIQSSINNFYKDEKYQSTFIQTAYIADGVGVSSDLKRYLEEEMFLSAYIRNVDLGHELCLIAKREV